MPLINKPFIPTPWSLPAGTTDVEATTFPHPIERYKHEPDEAIEDDLIYDQVKNRLFLGLKAYGEQVAFYRQKQAGVTCACVDALRQTAVSACPVCHGTRFVGGYEYLGKALVQFPQVPKTKIITELGLKLQETMNPWTMGVPLLRERDFLVRKMALPLSSPLRVVDEPVVRGNYSATSDILAHINLTTIWKVADSVQADQADYTEGTDYIMIGGEMVLQDSAAAPVSNYRTLRLLGKKPPIFIDADVTGQPLNVNAGLSAGINVKVQNSAAWSELKDATLAAGTGADAGYFVFTVASPGIHNTTTYPITSFVATIPGDRMVWLATGKNPVSGNPYYVTYEYVQTYTQRYQIKSVSAVAPQAAVIMQSFETTVMDPTHPIYDVGSPYDNGDMIDFRNGVTKAMVKQLFGEFDLAPGNQTDKKFNQEAGYY